MKSYRKSRSPFFCFVRSITGLGAMAAVASIMPIYGVVQAGIRLDVNVNESHTGEEVVFTVGHAGAGQEPVDVYMALQMPDDETPLYFWPDWVTEPVPCLTEWMPEHVSAVPVLRYTFAGFEPVGDYLMYAAIFKSGTFAEEGLIGQVAEASVTYSGDHIEPDPTDNTEVTDPEDNSDSETTGDTDPFDTSDVKDQTGPILQVRPEDQECVSKTPVFSIKFSAPVDLDSIWWHSEIEVKSLKSGKTARSYVGTDGRHWVELYFPPPDDMWVLHRLGGDETSFVRPETSDHGHTLLMPFMPVTVQGETFSLHSGGIYSFTLKFLDKAILEDSTSLAGITVGPISFSVE